MAVLAKPMIDDAHDRVQTTLDPQLDRIGTLTPRSAREIGPSRLGGVRSQGGAASSDLERRVWRDERPALLRHDLIPQVEHRTHAGEVGRAAARRRPRA